MNSKPMGIEGLMRVLELSGKARLRPSPVEWLGLEASLEMSIPQDYKRLVGAYGVGVVDEFIWPLSPNRGNPSLDLMTQIGKQAGVLRSLREQSSAAVPFRVFPEVGGLMVWGISDNGDTLHWLTEGLPEAWPTIVFESRGPRWVRYEFAATELIRRLLMKRIRCALFPEDFPSERPLFRPSRVWIG